MKNQNEKLTIRERALLLSAGLLGRRTEGAQKLFEAPPRGVVTIINDCRDDNARGRQEARVSALTGLPSVFIGATSDINAAGNLVDALDALEGISDEKTNRPKNAILVNVAPRGGEAKKHKNGTPFGYFWYGQTLVLSSIDGHTLSLVKKLGLTKHIHVLDIPAVLDVLAGEGTFPDSEKERITNTQFRSYEFLPRAAEYLLRRTHIRSGPVSIEEIPTIPSDYIWEVDNFGNCKTATLEGEVPGNRIGFRSKELELDFVRSYPFLKDVPNGELGVVVGSSGFRDRRFLEIVQKEGSAIQTLVRHGLTLPSIGKSH